MTRVSGKEPLKTSITSLKNVSKCFGCFWSQDHSVQKYTHVFWSSDHSESKIAETFSRTCLSDLSQKSSSLVCFQWADHYLKWNEMKWNKNDCFGPHQGSVGCSESFFEGKDHITRSFTSLMTLPSNAKQFFSCFFPCKVWSEIQKQDGRGEQIFSMEEDSGVQVLFVSLFMYFLINWSWSFWECESGNCSMFGLSKHTVPQNTCLDLAQKVVRIKQESVHDCFGFSSGCVNG